MTSSGKYTLYRDTMSDLVAAQAAASEGMHKRADMTWKDHLVMLLHIGAEIEHSLMVQYLYAAYSVGGNQIPEQHRARVRHWRDHILAVAKEEMGHLLTVQNVLTLLGAPINLGRLDLPWDIPFYPFPFQLEPLSLESVACYVFAEMPSEQEFETARQRSPKGRLLPRYEHFLAHDRARIVKLATKRAAQRGAHRVGGLYSEIMALIADKGRIGDHEFLDHTYPFQASVDDWGRGYQPRPKMLDAEGSLVGRAQAGDKPEPTVATAHVLVDRVATRSQAIAALQALAEQGEAPLLARDEDDELSHFDRFLGIYQELSLVGGRWSPARPVPTNPSTVRDPASDDSGYISCERSQQWAGLFNLRYRILLKYLAHTFTLSRTAVRGEPNLRAMVMHRVFAEMYNLKTIARILVRAPQGGADEAARAGPPFEMPYTLSLAEGEIERWIMHRDFLSSALKLSHSLLANAGGKERDYLQALIALDGQSLDWATRILSGLGRKGMPA